MEHSNSYLTGCTNKREWLYCSEPDSGLIRPLIKKFMSNHELFYYTSTNTLF